MARALGLTTFTRTLVNTSTNGVCVALVISRFNSFVIALRANIDGVAALACFEIASAYFVAGTFFCTLNVGTFVNAFAHPFSITHVQNCFVVFIITASPNFFLRIRALAGEFVTHSLGIASVLGLASDISTLVYAFAHAIAVTLVINCI
jgi:hypothetical protein